MAEFNTAHELIKRTYAAADVHIVREEPALDRKMNINDCGCGREDRQFARRDTMLINCK